MVVDFHPSKDSRNLLRLLEKCEKLASDRKKLTPEIRELLETYVQDATALLAEVSSRSNELEPEILAEFVRKVDFLKNVTDREKMKRAVEKGSAVSRVYSANTSVCDQQLESDVRIQARLEYESDAREKLLDTKRATGSDREQLFRRTQRNTERYSEKQENEATEFVLQHQRNVQEQITDELTQMASALKSSHLAIRNRIQEDVQVLDNTARLITKNDENMRKENHRLSLHLKNFSRNSCGIWLLLTFVCVVFMLVYIFVIKVLPSAS